MSRIYPIAFATAVALGAFALGAGTPSSEAAAISAASVSTLPDVVKTASPVIRVVHPHRHGPLIHRHQHRVQPQQRPSAPSAQRPRPQPPSAPSAQRPRPQPSFRQPPPPPSIDRHAHTYQPRVHGPRLRSRTDRNKYYYLGYWYAFPFWLYAVPLESNWEKHVRWCLDRYRSYNPNTDMFLGYDGRYHRCRSPYRP
jgi:hypothetical protein